MKHNYKHKVIKSTLHQAQIRLFNRLEDMLDLIEPTFKVPPVSPPSMVGFVMPKLSKWQRIQYPLRCTLVEIAKALCYAAAFKLMRVI